MKKLIVLCLLMSFGVTTYSQTKKTSPQKSAPAKVETPKVSPTMSDGVAVPTKAEDVNKPKQVVTDVPNLGEDEINAKWVAYMTPGMEHELLAKQEGDWTEEITIWTHLGAEPMTNNAKVKIQMILGGRYQQTTHRGEFMGMPFEGIGITAFDNASKKYYTSWIDNMSTGLVFSTGTIDPKTNAMVFFGEQPDPITGKITKVREVLTQVLDNEIILEMFNTPPGKEEFMSMRIVMKR